MLPVSGPKPPSLRSIGTSGEAEKGLPVKLLVYAYRFTTNFVFLADGLFQPELHREV